VQVTAYGRQTVPDNGLVRSCDLLNFLKAPIISLERLNLKSSHDINSSNRMTHHPQKGRGYGHVAVLKFCQVSMSSIFGLFVTQTGHISGSILTIYTSYEVFPRKHVPFGGFVDITPIKVAQWRNGYRALDLRSTGRGFNSCSRQSCVTTLGKVIYTYVPLSPSNITWYRPRGGDALRLGR